MSSPTYGSDPDVPQGGAPQGRPAWDAPSDPAQGYGGPAATGPAQGYGPAPSFSGTPAEYGAGSPRPQQVLVAAILGFVVAVFALLASLGSFALAGVFGWFALFGVVYLILTILNIWGGVQALQGKGSRILKLAGLITAGLAALGFVLALVQGSFDIWSLLLVAAGAGIVVLLNQPASQRWFASRGTA